MPTFHDHSQNQVMVVMSYNRPLAVARRYPYHPGWYLKAHGFSWTDPRARKPNVFGIVQPQFLQVATKREARKILAAITAA
jgi:hypothetical protein